MGYSWHWRLDDDSILTADIGYDVFQFMENNGKKYGYVNTVMDGPECVKGLWEFTDRFLNGSFGKSMFYNEWPRGQVFYNNFEISHSSVWRSSRYRSFFEQVDREGGIYYSRRRFVETSAKMTPRRVLRETFFFSAGTTMAGKDTGCRLTSRKNFG